MAASNGSITTFSSCASSRLIQVAASWKFEARKATKSKVGERTEITSVVSSLQQGSWTGDDTDNSCSIIKEDRQNRLVACRMASLARYFNGHPRDEGNAPSETNKPHPTVLQQIFQLNDMVSENGEPYYQGGKASFAINGWDGAMSYRNGWLAPKWEAKRGQEKVTGVFGSSVITSSVEEGSMTPVAAN